MKGPNSKRPRGYRGNGRRPGFHGRGSTFESNGPEGKIRGTAFQVIEKYQALAQDALSAGDRIGAENFFQHAEHYSRVVAANGWDQREQQNPREQRDQQNPREQRDQRDPREQRDQRDPREQRDQRDPRGQRPHGQQPQPPHPQQWDEPEQKPGGEHEPAAGAEPQPQAAAGEDAPDAAEEHVPQTS